MKLTGDSVSGGVAVGRLFIYAPNRRDDTPSLETLAPEQQEERLQKAIRDTDEQLAAAQLQMVETDARSSEIFKAQRSFLSDPAILGLIRQQLDGGAELSAAVDSAYTTVASMIGSVSNDRIRERAADILDVKGRLLSNLCTREEEIALPEEQVIVAVRELLPSDIVVLSNRNIAGIVTEIGGSTSHSAILAKALQIPAVFGVEGLMDTVRDGMIAGLDAEDGELFLDPEDECISRLEEKRLHLAAQYDRILEEQNIPSETADGAHIDIGVNIGSDEDEVPHNVDYVGLFRTEFVFIHSDHLPTEEEQFRIYQRVAQNHPDQPICIRTLDIGGDKTLPYMELPKESNPFLGRRALRLCLDEPELFDTQLRAILRASAFGKLMIMIPMVGSLDDIRTAKAAVRRNMAALDEMRVVYDRNIPVGIMVEIPSVAMVAELAAAETDFASIGTNDLTQYLTASDRTNSSVAAYYQSFHPAVFRMIGQVARAYSSRGKRVSVCGELGGNPLAVPVLIGLGVTGLSMNAASVPEVKHTVHSFTRAEACAVAEAVLQFGTEAEITEYLKKQVEERI